MTNSRRQILISVNFKLQASFFLRFQDAADVLEKTLVFIACNYSVFRFLKVRCRSPHKAIFIRKRQVSHDFPSDSAVERSFECVEDHYAMDDLKQTYASVWAALEEIVSSETEEAWIWNGLNISDCAVRAVAEKEGLHTAFFELANIQGKLFVDPQGTNAQSLLCQNPEILKRFPFDGEAYRNWRESYIEAKLDQTTVPQARQRKIRTSAADLFEDWYGCAVKGGAFCRKFPLKKLLARIYRPSVPCSKEKPEDETYVFFPLQVSNDTQILINGNMTLLDAVEYALELAEQENLYLVVKPHPAEANPIYMKGLNQRLSRYPKAIFSQENTFRLLQGARRVVTINSTVGLEAMILGRPVEIIGKALYERFSEDDVARYISSYLLDIDYWGEDAVSVGQMQEVLDRGRLSR